jgi:hypothetical protein
VIYGGQSDNEDTLGSLFVYDLSTQQWEEPVNCESVPRAWHSTTYLKRKNLLVCFGGERVVHGSPQVLDDIMVLDTEIFLWYPPLVSGTPPSARSHARQRSTRRPFHDRSAAEPDTRRVCWEGSWWSSAGRGAASGRTAFMPSIATGESLLPSLPANS